MASIFHGKNHASLFKPGPKFAKLLSIDLDRSRDWISDNTRTPRTEHKFKKHTQRMSTKLKSFDAVGKCVLETYEILDMVLLQLPKKDILLAQRVSKSWKSIISRSIRMQRALCFAPSLPPPNYSKLRRNLLLHKMPKNGPWKLNTCGRYKSDDGANLGIHLAYELVDDIVGQYKPIEDYSDQFPDGSWKQMLLSRPLPTRVCVGLYNYGMECCIRDKTFENPNMTLGEVQEWLTETYMDSVASEAWREYIDEDRVVQKDVKAVVT